MLPTSELHKYLPKLVILPVLILCAVVSTTWFYLFLDGQKHNHRKHQSLLSALLKPSFDLFYNNPQKLEQLANSILVMDAHRALVLRDVNDTLLASFGSPNETALAVKAEASDTNQSSVSDKDYSYYLFKIYSSDDRDLKGTVVVQTEKYYEQLNTQKAITGLIIAITLFFLVLLYFVRKFDIVLSHPLRDIQNGIRAYLSGEYNSQIKVDKNSIYSELVALINNLAASHKSGQENHQENIEQTIQDLKETLESVEIQNIEIDLERKNAVQANRAKSEFLSNTSHELKTPLNSIIGFTELLEKTKLSTQQSEHLKSIVNAAKGLSSTINDILDYSRLEIGTLTLEHKPVNVRELLEEVVQQLGPTASRQNIRLISIIDHDVPDNLLGDPLRVKQVLTNLISNAIKFTPEGYVLVNISNELISDERYTLRFKVTDSGIGISSGQQDKLFSSAASQTPSTDYRQQSSGTGLGLIIAKGLVERMNGHIEVESSEGKGSTFWFTATFAKNLALKNYQKSRIDSMKNIQAVVIDRNTMSRMETTHYLRGWGANPLESPRIENAEALCQQHFDSSKFNILFIDVESAKQESSEKDLVNQILRLSNEYEAYCVLIYPLDENKLMKPQEKSEYFTETVKPLSYQQLYQLMCTQFGISAPNFYSEDSEEYQSEALKNIRVLTVDDNKANLKLVKELLKDKGVQTETAESGVQAIEMFKNSHYDLILMDVQMPEMDGMTATENIRKLETQGNRIPIVAVTAHAANEKKMALLIAGMDDYISKPINGEDLQHIFDRWLNKNDVPTERPKEPNKPTTQPKDAQAPTTPVNIQLSLKKTQNKPKLARDMLQMLIDSLPGTKKQILTLKESRNYSELQEVVHKLHGGCCYCGVPDLMSICAKVDSKLDKNSIDGINTDVQILIEKIDELSKWTDNIDLNELFTTK